MTLDSRMALTTDSVPLRGAVLCIDCECVTRGLSDQCLVCGSHSLMSLERLLGGSQVAQRPRQSSFVALINVEIEVSLHQVEPHVLNAAVEAMSSLLVPSLGSGRASIHLNVEPAESHSVAEIARAA